MPKLRLLIPFFLRRRIPTSVLNRAVLTKAGFEIKEAPALPFRLRFYTWDPFRNLIEIVHVEGDYVSGGEAAED